MPAGLVDANAADRIQIREHGTVWSVPATFPHGPRSALPWDQRAVPPRSGRRVYPVRSSGYIALDLEICLPTGGASMYKNSASAMVCMASGNHRVPYAILTVSGTSAAPLSRTVSSLCRAPSGSRFHRPTCSSSRYGLPPQEGWEKWQARALKAP
jgi:hypothetical protein